MSERASIFDDGSDFDVPHSRRNRASQKTETTAELIRAVAEKSEVPEQGACAEIESQIAREELRRRYTTGRNVQLQHQSSGEETLDAFCGDRRHGEMGSWRNIGTRRERRCRRNLA